MLGKAQTLKAVQIMGDMFPDAKPSLRSRTPFQYLVSVMLSAQATDVSVNQVTPTLFKDFPDPAAFAKASEAEIQADIRSIGLYRNKAKHIKAASQQLLTEFNGVVPKTHHELMSLPGVGRKTADVVLADAFHIPAFAVDTHVTRVTKRLKIVPESANTLKIEQIVTSKLPQELWITAHHRMIYFGRYHCTARQPKCDVCPLLEMCETGQQLLGQKSTTTPLK